MLQREFKGKVVHGYVCTNLEGRVGSSRICVYKLGGKGKGGGGGTTALRGVGRRNYCAERCIVLYSQKYYV